MLSNKKLMIFIQSHNILKLINNIIFWIKIDYRLVYKIEITSLSVEVWFIIEIELVYYLKTGWRIVGWLVFLFFIF